MNLICKIFGHSKKKIYANEKDMFGHNYVWQPRICNRCGKRLLI